ncbi:hypothetical protein [Leptospira kemamanensis]|uniref:hypothetical protein n=1 Tax=Leptospira kemamanensis TaxID=2484942 RepID=UPI001FC97ED3|nr:hypothetical protein [Leptospira kemamanensis]
MKKHQIVIFIFLILIGCKKEENAQAVSTTNNGKVDYKSIESEIAISEGSIISNKDINFEALPQFDVSILLKDFDFWLGKSENPYFFIKGIDDAAITREAFNEATIYFGFGYENGKLEYETQTHSPFDTAGSNSKGIIEKVKCSSYTDVIIKCKFDFGTATPANTNAYYVLGDCYHQRPSIGKCGR